MNLTRSELILRIPIFTLSQYEDTINAPRSGSHDHIMLIVFFQPSVTEHKGAHYPSHIYKKFQTLCDTS